MIFPDTAASKNVSDNPFFSISMNCSKIDKELHATDDEEQKLSMLPIIKY